ncbi:MAG: nuclear transport factor 2 family protein [Planctomycetaceae bacterium]|nr:nuclear transport factor 2 family protein [Planctomycetales bacterium]MCB9927396.1 nuclear transport factor 2 family protein [Planctomycetaceae bacterium]
MATEPDINAIADELDSVHVAARKAFCERNIEAYQNFFTEDLRYVQPDGKAIGRAQLMRDVSKQLAQFKTVDSEMTREFIAINDDGTVTQIASQNGTYSVSVFVVFTKAWKIKRRGRYTYRKTADGWRICDVEVLSETVN